MNMADRPSATVSTQTVPVDGCRLSVEIRNDEAHHGPTLVLLHHYGGSPRLFEPLLRQANVTSLRTVLYHARGWFPSTGTSPEDPTKYGIPEMASDLEKVIAATATDRESRGFVLVAHSMGAKVAQYYTSTCSATQRQMLKGLVLVAPAPLRGKDMPEQMKEQVLIAYHDAQHAEAGIRQNLLAREDALDNDLISQMVEDALRGSDNAKSAWPTYGTSSDFAHLQKGISIPVWVLRGDQDLQREEVGLLGEDQGWINKRVGNCGHMIPLEQPKVLAEHIVAFVIAHNI